MIGMLKRVWGWFDDRTGTGALLGPVLSHPVPPRTRLVLCLRAAPR